MSGAAVQISCPRQRDAALAGARAALPSPTRRSAAIPLLPASAPAAPQPGPPCPTRLVPDATSDVDAFQSHTRIARTIEAFVRDPDGQGRAIGLEGPWGSGKSTIVRLVAGALRGDDPDSEFAVFTFDAWAHEGDPLRRVFLERLVQFLLEKRWISGQRREVWEKRLEVLARRRRESDRRSVPRLSTLGIALAAAVLVVPAGTAWLNYNLRHYENVYRWIGWPHAPTILSVLLTLAPLVVALLAWARGWRSGHGGEALAVFADKGVAGSRDEVVETAVPTSVEFEREFWSLLDEILPDASRERRLVIVVDNLDRVSAEEAQRIWAALQTFFRGGAASHPGPAERLWLIVPYDPRAIRRVWERDGVGKGAATVAPAGGAAPAATRAPTIEKVTTSFLDKSFQVRYEVPAPVLPNWRKYLIDQLRQALPRHEADFHAVYRIIDTRRARGEPAPTPREMKQFVNQLAALHVQWQDVIPLPHLAYFVALRRASVAVADGLLQRTLPELEVAGLVGDGVAADLAALAFNVDRPLAAELLLREPIVEALESGDGERLRILQEIPDIFLPTLERVLADAIADWRKGDWRTQNRIAHAAYALLRSGLLDEPDAGDGAQHHARLVSMMRQQILRTLREVDRWGPSDEVLPDRLIAIWEAFADEDLRARMFRAAARSPAELMENYIASYRQEMFERWLNGVATLAAHLRRAGVDDLLASGVLLPENTELSPVAALALATQAAESAAPDGSLRTLFRWTDRDGFKSLAEDLAKAFAAGTVSHELYRVVRSVQATGAAIDWAPTIGAITRLLESGESDRRMDAASLAPALGIVFTLREEPAVRPLVRDVVGVGDGPELGMVPPGPPDPSLDEAQAYRILLLLHAVAAHLDPTLESQFPSRDRDADQRLRRLLSARPSVIPVLLRVLVEHDAAPLLYSAFDQLRNVGWLVTDLLDKASDKDARRLVTPEAVVRYWSFVASAVRRAGPPATPVTMPLVLDIIRWPLNRELLGFYASLLADARAHGEQVAEARRVLATWLLQHLEAWKPTSSSDGPADTAAAALLGRLRELGYTV